VNTRKDLTGFLRDEDKREPRNYILEQLSRKVWSGFRD